MDRKSDLGGGEPDREETVIARDRRSRYPGMPEPVRPGGQANKMQAAESNQLLKPRGSTTSKSVALVRRGGAL